ncbi:MAG: hypothetical protein COT73_12105 [Bdellovibrio sp. CG10_big_fil_rev_8_21_14_0_10_47_8]|nr:MAG: hypothetical protein COT73_12105 [Bdellovibrio sp. CG10_big_fil_rev_8_21_14_0_10_47_8]
MKTTSALNVISKAVLSLLSVAMVSCTMSSSVEDLASDSGGATSISLESKSDGSGSLISSINISVNDTATIYAIERSEAGAYIQNREVSWVLNGGIGSLNIQSNGKSAVYTGSSIGTAQIKVTSGDFQSTVSVTVSAQAAPRLDVRWWIDC